MAEEKRLTEFYLRNGVKIQVYSYNPPVITVSGEDGKDRKINNQEGRLLAFLVTHYNQTFTRHAVALAIYRIKYQIGEEIFAGHENLNDEDREKIIEKELKTKYGISDIDGVIKNYLTKAKNLISESKDNSAYIVNQDGLLSFVYDIDTHSNVVSPRVSSPSDTSEEETHANTADSQNSGGSDADVEQLIKLFNENTPEGTRLTPEKIRGMDSELISGILKMFTDPHEQSGVATPTKQPTQISSAIVIPEISPELAVTQPGVQQRNTPLPAQENKVDVILKEFNERIDSFERNNNFVERLDNFYEKEKGEDLSEADASELEELIDNYLLHIKAFIHSQDRTIADAAKEHYREANIIYTAMMSNLELHLDEIMRRYNRTIVGFLLSLADISILLEIIGQLINALHIARESANNNESSLLEIADADRQARRNLKEYEEREEKQKEKLAQSTSHNLRI